MSRPLNGLPEGVRPQDLPTIAELPRLRVRYGKDGRLAYLGNLEVLNTVERSVRRARLPFSIGNGFARRMRIQYCQALPLGAASACEYYDLRLEEALDPAEALARLVAATPPGLAPVACAYVDGRLPALEGWLDRSLWEVELVGEGPEPEALACAVDGIRQQGCLSYLRGTKEKTVDVAGSLVGFSASSAGGTTSARMEVVSTGGAALRPQVLLSAAFKRLGCAEAPMLRVRRAGQWHTAPDGSLVEAF